MSRRNAWNQQVEASPLLGDSDEKKTRCGLAELQTDMIAAAFGSGP
jgi:hypothetical protein